MDNLFILLCITQNNIENNIKPEIYRVVTQSLSNIHRSNFPLYAIVPLLTLMYTRKSCKRQQNQ